MARKVKATNPLKNKRIVIVAAKFNEFITKRLLNPCLMELERCGIQRNNITVVWVPGSFEIPVTAQALARKKTVDAVICLGAVIKGETYHFELVAKNAASGILQASLQTGKPVIFGVLTTYTVDQAYKRSEASGDNKGRDTATAAIEMINLLSQIR